VVGFRRKKGPLQSTFALDVAACLRENSVLRRVYRFIFKGVIPLFALLIVAAVLLVVAAGGVIFNQALFDGMSAAGFFCKGTLDAKASKQEKTGTNHGFTTDQMCWPTDWYSRKAGVIASP
jgi:hypothetical protein